MSSFIGVGAGIFWGVQRIFCRNLYEKRFCNKLSHYEFSAAVGTFYFPAPYCLTKLIK